MWKQVLNRLVLALLSAFVLSSFAYGETPFIADRLVYNANTQEIVAIGNVEIDSEEGYFYLDELTYDIETGQITIRGNVRGVLAGGERVMGEYAFLDPDTKEIILKNARILLASKLQIVANTIKDNDNVTYGENVVVTSCEVCIVNPVPIWQIKADQILRDKPNKKIYFRNATMQILGVPILKLRNFRIPDAGVERMSGFLQPELILSDLYNPGIRTPYFHVINDQSDILLTPYITSAGVFNIETRYRHQIKGGLVQLDGAYSVSDDQGEFGRYYLQSKIDGNLTKNIQLSAKYTLNSDNDFAPDFSYENASTNYLTLSSTNNSSDTLLEVIDYRAKTIAGESGNNPLVLPHLSHRTTQALGVGSVYNSEIDVLALDNNTRDDVLRLSSSNTVNKVVALPTGISLKGLVGLRGQAYAFGEIGDGSFETATRISPILALDASMPFSKQTDKATSLVVPRMQLIWSDNYETGADIINSDALFIENDYISLFSLNRYSGQDRLESGLRANLGLSYIHQSNSGANIDIGIGRVVRLSPDATLSEFTGYDKYDGEWVGLVNYVSPHGYSIYARGAFNDALGLSRGEVGVDLTGEDYSYSIDGAYLAPEPQIGYNYIRQEFTIAGNYHFAPNWQTDFGIQYDLVSDYALNTRFGLTYGNECIEVSGSFVQDYNRGEGIDPETTFSMNVVFIGLGQAPKRDWPRRQCKSASFLN